jgi:hypothetical protein
MRKRRWIIVGGLLILLAAAVFGYWFDLLPLPEVEDGNYPLQPVSVSAVNVKWPGIVRAQTGWWRNGAKENVVWVAKATGWKTAPFPQVKAYPKLKSGRPLYGAVDFSQWRIDAAKPSAHFFVVDESRGTGKGYDRLYFDLNHDADLTNDPPTMPLADAGSPSYPFDGDKKTSTSFASLQMLFDFGPAFGTMPVEIVPSLSTYNEQLQMHFSAAEARVGTIRMGRYRFQAILTQSGMITGRYDKPSTELHLWTTGFCQVPFRWSSWGGESLCSLRPLDRKLYSLSVTPTGDTLMVRRFRGELGVLRIEPGNRLMADVAMSGSLASENTVVPVGFPGSVRECEVPVGDYYPQQLRLRYGRLSFWLTNNYHTDGKHHGAVGKSLCAVKIRKDRPFVLDFSNRPEVMFVDPAKDRSFKPGDEVSVNAVLVDPVLNTMIRGLDDTSRTVKKTVNGQTNEMNVSLDPTVTIACSSGKTVVQSTMPFG